MTRVFNFSAGPAAIPTEVLEKARDELLDYDGSGMSIMEHSHRGTFYEKVHAQAKALVRSLLNLSDEYEILFLQGGASLQFSMLPMNFLTPDRSADYVLTGQWSVLAHREAALLGSARKVASSEDTGFDQIPELKMSDFDPGAEYIHITSNNTIYGTQYQSFPDTGDVPLACDMSSDIMSRAMDIRPFAMIYAGAQKNLGPAGLALVIIRRQWLDRANTGLPSMLAYHSHVAKDSRYNTPPTFGIYMMRNVLLWISEMGGLEAMGKRNAEKAGLLYRTIDDSVGFYTGCARRESRSSMNVTFRLPNVDLEKLFVSEANEAGLMNLKGYRSVGGIRASIYNALGLDAVRALADFMKRFVKEKG